MTIKKEAAYHEAAHAVLAYNSKFHALVGEISLAQYGAGDIYISLSKSKRKAAGVTPNPIDKEITKDLAVILCGGLAGETIASKNDNTLSPNPSCAIPDHQLATQQLQGAGLSEEYDCYEQSAIKELESNWATVERLADYLFTNHTAQPDEILSIINNA